MSPAVPAWCTPLSLARGLLPRGPGRAPLCRPGTLHRPQHLALSVLPLWSRALSKSHSGGSLPQAGPGWRRTLAASAGGGTSTMQGEAKEEEGGGGPGPAPETGALAKEKCVPCHDKTLKALPREEAQALQQEVPQWQLVEVEGALRLRRDWKTKNFVKGLELFQRIAQIAEAEGHHPDLHLEGWNNARVEIFTHTIGGLHKNDFILAAKIDAVDVADLLRKPKKSLAQ